MATVAPLISLGGIPGLTCPLTKDGLVFSRGAYNQFGDCPNNQQPDQVHIDALGEICRDYGVESVFCIHLVHRHGSIPSDTVMVGYKVQELNGIWTKPTNFHDADLTKLRGHIFCVLNGALIPYELREGSLIDVSNIDQAFFTTIAEYIKTHGLENILGLQVCSEGFGGVEFELEDKEGLVTTIMLPQSEANYGKIIQTTGWYFGSPPMDEEKHAETVKGPHKVFVKFPLDDTEALKKLVVENELRLC